MTAKIIIIALIAISWLGTLTSIGSIGKERKPYSIEYGIASVIVSLIMTGVWVYILYQL